MIAVGGRHRPEDRPAGRRRHLELRRLQLAQRQRQHALQHRHVDVLALARRAALVQRRGDGAEGVGAGHDVGDVDAAVVGRRAALLVGQMRQIVAGGGVDHGRVGRQVGGGPRLAVARDRAVDEARVGFAERGDSRGRAGASRPAGSSRPGCRRRSASRRTASTARSVLEVEHHAPLARVELAEVAAGAVAQRRARCASRRPPAPRS